jgi:hypothetical protein
MKCESVVQAWVTLLGAALLAMSLAGCGTRVDTLWSPAVAHLPRPMDPKTDPAAVDVYNALYGERPRRPTTDVATLVARQESEFSLDGSRAILAKLRRRAAFLGCDAVQVLDMDNVLLSTGGRRTRWQYGYRATCLLYRALSDSRARAECAPGRCMGSAP